MSQYSLNSLLSLGISIYLLLFYFFSQIGPHLANAGPYANLQRGLFSFTKLMDSNFEWNLWKVNEMSLKNKFDANESYSGGHTSLEIHDNTHS